MKNGWRGGFREKLFSCQTLPLSSWVVDFFFFSSVFWVTAYLSVSFILCFDGTVVPRLFSSSAASHWVAEPLETSHFLIKRKISAEILPVVDQVLGAALDDS